MGSSAGTSNSSTTTGQESQTKTEPWRWAVPHLKTQLGNISGEQGGYKPTAAETGAIDQLSTNAQAGNPFTGQITGLANDLFTGGTDRTGMVSDAYSNYQKQAQPYLDPGYLDPSSNPAFKNYMDTTANDIQTRVNSMFAGAGRDMSGMNQQTLARGITEGTAPMFANQYNQNVQTQRGVMDNLYNAGNTSAGVLSSMDQTALGNRAQGVGAAGMALEAQNYGPNSVLQAEAMRRGIPLQNLAQLNSLILPIAGMGGTSNTSGTATSTGTQTMSPVQQAMGWSQAFSPFLPKVSFTGTI
jgi:hypothetical protein